MVVSHCSNIKYCLLIDRIGMVSFYRVKVYIFPSGYLYHNNIISSGVIFTIVSEIGRVYHRIRRT